MTCKRVVDPQTKVRVASDHKSVETTNLKMCLNPFDEIAVEEAVRMREKKIADEVVCVSVGPIKAQDTLRTALAMGCDRAVHVATDLPSDLVRTF